MVNKTWLKVKTIKSKSKKQCVSQVEIFPEGRPTDGGLQSLSADVSDWV